MLAGQVEVWLAIIDANLVVFGHQIGIMRHHKAIIGHGGGDKVVRLVGRKLVFMMVMLLLVGMMAVVVVVVEIERELGVHVGCQVVAVVLVVFV